MRKTACSIVFLTFLLVLHAGLTPAQAADPFEMLVLGDSHISGQGLEPKNKFYFLVKEWLQNEVFGTSRNVELKVKAHGGSRITLHKEELAAMLKKGDDINKFHYDEANISSPSIRHQVDVAKSEYADPGTVDLVMLSGCITDVLVADIINPFYPEKKLRSRIKRFCGEAMYSLLEHVTTSFPNAAVVVVGYFPISSKKSDIGAMVRYFLKIVGMPHKLQWTFTNSLSRQFLKILRGKMAKRSRIWVTESNREMRAAIEKINARLDRPKLHFVETPIPEDRSYGTKNSLLWEIGEDHLPNDETYNERVVGCEQVFTEMKYQHYGRLSRRMCELSSVAHPNVEGSIAYAEAIKRRLTEDVLLRAQTNAVHGN